jgi:arginyl-tRNA synthetase
MNIFEKYLKLIINTVDKNILKLGIENTNEFKGVIVESPPVEFDFDLSCNICLILAKKNNQNPKRLAEEIKDLLLKNIKEISTIDIAGPGFLNIKLNDNAVKNIIEKIFSSGASYGSSKNNEKFNIEFVSANPTGPLHVGHCRGAIYGDVLANLLKFNGNIVTKEYYINDYGNQIINFTKSVFLRIRELKYNEKFTGGEDLYPGEYIIEISKKIISDLPNENFENLKSCYNLLSKKSLDYSMNLIKDDLKRLGIKHDNFFSESEIVNNKLVNKAVERLKQDKFVEEGYLEPPKGEDSVNWKKSKKLIFKSTLFADDADRALQKNDGSWTYFANDVAYHLNKISRNYDHLINVLGADHIGYIKRITAAVNALSKNKVKLDCKVCQLVKLFKNGKPFKMSKRAGDFISANDLLNEVNKDSIRFMMLSRSNDVELEFDFDKVLEKSKDNPVFYVQYSYARISSLVRTLKIDLKENLTFEKKFKLNQYEIRLLRKIFEWPKIVETSSKKFEPHRISYYLYELATLFHSYWSKGNENDEFKFVKDNKIKNFDTISIIKILAIVIENGMKILDVSLPKKM